MKTEIINIKTDPKTKRLAQKAAGNLGVSLSTAINGLLQHFIHTQTLILTNRLAKKLDLWQLSKEENGQDAGGHSGLAVLKQYQGILPKNFPSGKAYITKLRKRMSSEWQRKINS